MSARGRKVLDDIRTFALGLPGAFEDNPWGEEPVIKVGKKIFVFLGSAEKPAISIKLPDSADQALDTPGGGPDRLRARPPWMGHHARRPGRRAPRRGGGLDRGELPRHRPEEARRRARRRRLNEVTRPAGPFSSWLETMEGALAGERDADVPCDGCTACCTSSQFVHIEPDETDTLDRIPAELRFPAPGRPQGHVVLGYDEQGRCPMLVDDRCSIYEHRPRTCRTYDCRIFPATGLSIADDRDKAAIAERVSTWRFDHPEPADRADHDAVRAAAAFVDEHPEVLPTGAAPSTTQRAVLAIEVHRSFLGRRPTVDEVKVEVTRRTTGGRERRPRR